MYTNILKYFINDQSTIKGNNEISQRYKRITPDNYDYKTTKKNNKKKDSLNQFNSNKNILNKPPIELTKKSNIDTKRYALIEDNRKSDRAIFKRSAEEEELDEILNHPKLSSDSFDENRKVLTRSIEEFIESVPASNPEQTKFLEQSAILKSSDDTDQHQQYRLQSRSKFENINSREEKEMSSIKTLSSLSVPAGSNDQDGSGEDDESPLTEGKGIIVLSYMVEGLIKGKAI